LGLKAPIPVALFTALLLLIQVLPIHHSSGEEGLRQTETRGETVWSGNITITEDTTIPVGETLRIMPGARVTFTRGVRLDVYGPLLAKGTPERPIRLGGPEEWAGVFLHSTTAEVSHLIVENANCGLSAENSRVAVKNSTFSGYTFLFSSTTGATISWVNSTFSSGSVFVDTTSSAQVRYFLQVETVDVMYGPLASSEVILRPTSDGEPLRFQTDENGTTPLVEVVALTFSGGMIPQSFGYTVEVKVLGSTWWYHLYTPSEEGNLIRTVASHIPPTLLNFSTSVVVEEDTPTLIPLEFYTPGNHSPTFQVRTTSPFVSYVDDPPTLFIFAPTPSSLDGEVRLCVWDGLSWGNYTLQTSVRERNDPPEVFLPYPSIVINPGEDVILPVSISDEETPVGQLFVTTSLPWVTCDSENGTILLEAPEDLIPALLYINVSDYLSVESAALLITPPPLYGPPELLKELPKISLEEEGTASLNLSSYFRDPFGFEVVGTRGEVVSCQLEGSTLLIEGLKDCWGEGEIYLKVIGEGGGVELYTLEVAVSPVSDPPELLNPICYPSDTSVGLYTFEVTYRDSDGDRPRLLSLILDGEEHPLEVPRRPLDFSGGVRLSFGIRLPEGNHSFLFRAIDQWGEETSTEVLGGISVGEHFTERYWEGGAVRARYLGRGPGEVTPALDSSPPPQARIGARVYLNISLMLEVRGELDVRKFDIIIDLSQQALGDVIISTAKAYLFNGDIPVDIPSDYSSAEGSLTLHLTDPLPYRIYLYALPSSSRDSDGDAVPDLWDLFPLDPLEWRDSDLDGVGDVEDPDDDNDGFSDEVEIACGSDPLSSLSVPRDTDSDGVPDPLDEDTDGDGMPDRWEAMKGLDPFDPSDADEDPDGDGVTNLQEYRRGEEAWSSGASGVGGYGWVSYVLYALAALLGGLVVYTLKREGFLG